MKTRELTCAECVYCWKDENDSFSCCHYESCGDWDPAPCEQPESDPEGEGEYKVMYEGYIFDGDTDGLNVHYYEDWSEVKSLLDCYGDVMTVEHVISGAVWEDGEWYA